jgi:2-dehydro-3-deoxyphosphogluconate aldolase/(4S)-4-hydroxy-2-oxoglutarate aldolase
MCDVKDKIKKYRIIPVIAIEEKENALPLADCLTKGGLPLIEITFRTKIAPDVINLLKKERPEILLGAGTILSVDNLNKAIDCGASFAVSPGINPKVVKEAVKMDFPFFPGVITPGDIEKALDLGVRILKFFPAEAAGGIKLLKSLESPYSHMGIKFIPTGGITLQNMADYLSLSSVLAVSGTWLAKKENISNGNWVKISRNCQESVNKI